MCFVARNALRGRPHCRRLPTSALKLQRHIRQMVGAITHRCGCKDSSWFKRRPNQPDVALAVSHRTGSYGPKQLMSGPASRAAEAATLDILITCQAHGRCAAAGKSDARFVTAQGSPPSSRATCGSKQAAEARPAVQARVAEQRPMVVAAQGSRKSSSDEGCGRRDVTDPESRRPTKHDVSESMANNLQPYFVHWRWDLCSTHR